MSQGEQIVAAARGWLGTRFHHQGRLKKTASHKGGVDCLGLLMGVAAELNLSTPDGYPLINMDEVNYPHFPDGDHLKTQLATALRIIPVGGILPGDVLLLRVEIHPQHLAIVTNWNQQLGIIHAYAPARAVIEHTLDDWWRSRIVLAYRPY